MDIRPDHLLGLSGISADDRRFSELSPTERARILAEFTPLTGLDLLFKFKSFSIPKVHYSQVFWLVVRPVRIRVMRSLIVLWVVLGLARHQMPPIRHFIDIVVGCTSVLILAGIYQWLRAERYFSDAMEDIRSGVTKAERDESDARSREKWSG